MTAPRGVYGPRCGSSWRMRSRRPCQSTSRGSGAFTGSEATCRTCQLAGQQGVDDRLGLALVARHSQAPAESRPLPRQAQARTAILVDEFLEHARGRQLGHHRVRARRCGPRPSVEGSEPERIESQAPRLTCRGSSGPAHPADAQAGNAAETRSLRTERGRSAERMLTRRGEPPAQPDDRRDRPPRLVRRGPAQGRARGMRRYFGLVLAAGEIIGLAAPLAALDGVPLESATTMCRGQRHGIYCVFDIVRRGRRHHERAVHRLSRDRGPCVRGHERRRAGRREPQGRRDVREPRFPE